MKFRLSPLAALLALAACHSQTQPATTADAPAAATNPTPAPPATVADSPGASYRVYRGLLPGQTDSITLHLVTAPQPFYPYPTRRGSYYGADGHPYEMQRRSSAPDSLVLSDWSFAHDSSYTQPTWHLKQQPGGTLAGTDATGRPMRLRPVAAPAGGLTFAVRCFADSLPAYPKRVSGSPYARVNLQALVPVGGPAGLVASLLRDLRGDTADTQAMLVLPAVYQQQRDTFYRRYRADVAEHVVEHLDYASQTSVSVLFQQGCLLSLGFSTYIYSGGMYGLDTTTIASYDLRTGRRLRYDDIFLPTARRPLRTLLMRATNDPLGLHPEKPVHGPPYLLHIMPVTRNVCLTAGGVVFGYEPGELGQDEVRLFVPLTQLHGLLRKGLPLPGAAGVAAR